jgi:hypothetical protein
MGISRTLWARACQVMGRPYAAVALALVSTRQAGHFTSSSGGYFAGMLRKYEKGELRLTGSLWRCARRNGASDAKRCTDHRAAPDTRHEGEKYAGHRVFSNRSATSGGRGAEVMAARAWQDRNLSGGPDPRTRKAGVIQGPLQTTQSAPASRPRCGRGCHRPSLNAGASNFAQLAVSD